jgi:hypothetical protein
MKLIMLPLLVSVAYIGFEHRDAAIDLYRAAYPADPVKREALEQCVRRDTNFNRLDTIDRDRCYAAVAARVAVDTAPVPSPAHPYNPSHLPGNDIRRAEANDTYRVARAAAVAPAVPTVAAPHHAARNSPTQ